MALLQIIDKLRVIKKMGFVKTHRANDTGIGKTLEDLLNIKENNLKLPDLGEIELKAKRIDSQSMLTIATKSPLPPSVNRILFEKYKYLDSDGFYNLHSTVYGSKYNPQGFKINLNGNKLILENKEKIKAYWLTSIFKDTLVSKSNKILLVFAKTKGEKKTLSENFHYFEAYLLYGLNINKFKKTIQQDKLKVDIRIGCYRSGKNAGKYHDHGTGFRINKKDFLQLFDNFKQLI